MSEEEVDLATWRWDQATWRWNEHVPDPVLPDDDGPPTIPAPPPAADFSQDCKCDSGKPDLHLLPPEAWLLELTLEELEGVARVREYGDSKYAPGSWRAVENAVPRYRAAGLRHVAAMAAGEELDPESGLPHRHHALCNAVLVLAHIAGGGRRKQ